jgi:tungstate transport system substrate-binding protein
MPSLSLRFALATILILSFALCAKQGSTQTIKMATTTSIEDSGLLNHLLPEFSSDTDIKVLPIARGTGAAIAEARQGNVDMVFTHAKALEEEFVAAGYGTQRYPVMFNDFVLAGPASDPAGITGSKDISTALQKLASPDSNAIFISRGDESGTHILEKALWATAGAEMPPQRYLSIGQGMGKTLLMAWEKQAYTLTDRATFLRFNQGHSESRLVIVLQGDVALHNEYAVIPVNPEKFSGIQFKEAFKFVEWLQSEKGRKLIDSFEINGQQVFFSIEPGR